MREITIDNSVSYVNKDDHSHRVKLHLFQTRENRRISGKM